MKIRTSRVKGPLATYRETRGPTGERYAKSKSDRQQRNRDRFAVGGSADDRRIMRNARKLERR